MPNIQHGIWEKNGLATTVTFNPPFSSIPTVVISPYYPGGAVGAIETIVSITPSTFEVTSANTSTPGFPYSITWIAIEG